VGLWTTTAIDEISIHLYDAIEPPVGWAESVGHHNVSVGEVPLGGVKGASFDRVSRRWRDAGASAVFGWRFDGSSEAERSQFKTSTTTFCRR
jgi:hypothetical protein